MKLAPLFALATAATLAGVGVAFRGLDDDPLLALPGPRRDVEAFKDVARQFQIDRTVIVGFEPAELWTADGLSRLRKATRALAVAPGVARADGITELLDLDVGGGGADADAGAVVGRGDKRKDAESPREEASDFASLRLGALALKSSLAGAGADAGAETEEEEAAGEAVVGPLVGEIPRDAAGMLALRKRVDRSLAAARLLSPDRRAALIVVTLKEARGDGAARGLAAIQATSRRELGAGEVHLLGFPVVAGAALEAARVPVAILLPLALVVAFGALSWCAGARFAASSFAVWAFAGATGLFARSLLEAVPMLAIVDTLYALPAAVLFVVAAQIGWRAAFLAAPCAALVAGVPFAGGASWQIAASVLAAGLAAGGMRAWRGLYGEVALPVCRESPKWVALVGDGGAAVAAVIGAVALLAADSFDAPSPSPSTSLSASHKAVRAESWYATRFGIRDTTFWPVRGDLRDPSVLAGVDRAVTALREGRSETGMRAVVRVDAITDVVRLVAKGFGGSAELPDTRAKVEAIFGLLRGQSEVANLMRRAAGDVVRSVVVVHLAERFRRVRDREMPFVGPQVGFLKSLESAAWQVVVLAIVTAVLLVVVLALGARPAPGFGLIGLAALFYPLRETGQPNLGPLLGGVAGAAVVAIAVGLAARGSRSVGTGVPRSYFLPLAISLPFALLAFVPVKPIAWTGVGLAASGVVATISALAWWRPGAARKESP